MIKQTRSGEMMASGGETGRSPVSSSSSASSVGLEALFPAVETEPAVGDGNPELTGLRERLQDWLSPYEPLVLWVQRLLVWDRPLHSIFAAVTLNTVFWLLSSTSLRPLFLFSLCLIGLMLLEKWKDRLPSINVQCPEVSITERESVMMQPKLLSITELSHHLAESYVTCNLYIQEMVQYKRSNHGKFCVLVCAGCSVLAIVGHYVPGIMISYIMLISVLLWPLVVYHELIQKMYTGLEPILMKLDYSMKGGTQHRKHDKKRAKKEVEEGDEPQAETESESEEELSCFSPTVDVKTTALAMAITDSELSDEEASILESGGFSVSRATTPQLPEDHVQQSVNSEPEESLSRDLPGFPSVEEFFTGHGLPRFLTPLSSHGQGTSMELHETEPQNPAGLSIQHLASPLHFVNTHFSGHGQSVRASQNEAVKTISQGNSQSLEALSEEIVSTAISSVLQNTLSALLHSGEDSKAPSIAEFLPAEATAMQSTLCETVLRDGDTAMATMDTKQSPIGPLLPTEEEDFELLDQSELEQMDNEMGLSSEGQGASDTEPIPPEHSHYSQQS